MEFYQSSNYFTPSINKLKFKDGLNIFWDAFCLWKKAPFTLGAMLICTAFLGVVGYSWLGQALERSSHDIAPLIGGIGFIFMLTSIPFFGSFIYSAARLEAGDELKIRHLIEGFKNKLATQIMLSLVSALYIGLITVSFYGAMDEFGTRYENLSLYENSSFVYIVAFLTLLLPILVSFWAALPLYRWSNLGIVSAFFFSLKAYAKNILVLTFLWLLLIVILCVLILNTTFGVLMLPFSPLLLLAIYTTFRQTIELVPNK